MAEFSGPFTGSPIATQLQWSRMARRWGLDGVHAEDPGSTALTIVGNSTSKVTVRPGDAFVAGFYYHLDTNKLLDVATNAGSVARIDLVVLRADMGDGEVTAKYKTGGTTAPTLIQDETGVYEIPLAQCTVAAGSSVVTAVNVLDRRWFTDRGAIPGVPGDGRPAAKGQLRVEGTNLYLGDGAVWRWVASTGIEEASYTPVWNAGTTAFHWGTGATNLGRYQVQDGRVHLNIHVVVTGNPVSLPDPIQVTLPPGYPCSPAHRGLLHWNLQSVNGEGSALGSALLFPNETTTKIARLRYAVQVGATSDAIPKSENVLTNSPYNIRAGDILTIDGSYWLA
ncbi:hypothetical protein [Streptomyces sp. NPDC058653]|uniref:hypothetical protein n=1 Tax=Streptomyces sp. NPDC058653 TaxID=3346576 RepID=UPI003655FE3C